MQGDTNRAVSNEPLITQPITLRSLSTILATAVVQALIRGGLVVQVQVLVIGGLVGLTIAIAVVLSEEIIKEQKSKAYI